VQAMEEVAKSSRVHKNGCPAGATNYLLTEAAFGNLGVPDIGAGRE
jgi:hypothetical protein